jgi:23S rRNA pseudouridine1911/1915/1917 synthase
MELNVLYEDNHLIAVEKSAGILVQPRLRSAWSGYYGGQEKEIVLFDEVKKYLKEKYKKPGNVFLGLLHRLDRPVFGIVLFAKTSKGASRLSEQFRNHKIGKIYHAIVAGIPDKKEGTLINYLKKEESPSSGAKRAVIVGEKQGQLAELNYLVIAYGSKYSLLKIQILSGRFHQIRAQLSHAGWPILGDLKYGAPFALPDKSIALAATNLSFQTATTKENKEISIPIPKSWEEYLG